MSQALPLPDKLSADISKGINCNVIAAQFGDGYSQRSAAGLNNTMDSWNISWVWLNTTDANTVTSILMASGGYDVLTWIPRDETITKKFVLVPDSIRVIFNGKKQKISCQIKQVY